MRSLKVRRYAARLIDMNEYLDSSPGTILSDKIVVTKLINILLNIMANSWSKQDYVQGLDYEYISFKKAVNMFERMEIAEYIYKGVLELSYKMYLGRWQPLWSQQEYKRRRRLV